MPAFVFGEGRACDFLLHYYSLPERGTLPPHLPLPAATFLLEFQAEDCRPPSCRGLLQGAASWAATVLARDASLTTSWVSDASPPVHPVLPGDSKPGAMLGAQGGWGWAWLWAVKEMPQNWSVTPVSQICEFTHNHKIVDLGWLSFMARK